MGRKELEAAHSRSMERQDYGYGWLLANVRSHAVRFAWGYGGKWSMSFPIWR
jgi:hypothetical protein